jgi:hypothetical protein
MFIVSNSLGEGRQSGLDRRNRRTDLRRNEDVLTGDAGPAEAFFDPAFVSVSSSCIDIWVTTGAERKQ